MNNVNVVIFFFGLVAYIFLQIGAAIVKQDLLDEEDLVYGAHWDNYRKTWIDSDYTRNTNFTILPPAIQPTLFTYCEVGAHVWYSPPYSDVQVCVNCKKER